MKLFHYTTQHAVDGIRNSGVWIRSVNNKAAPNTISLTTDSSNLGHGLPDGREISAQQAQSLPHHSSGGKFYCHNHTLYRLSLELKEVNFHLIRATKYHDPQLLLALDIAAWDPCGGAMDDLKLLEIARKLASGDLPRKSATWWYYTKDVPISQIRSIERLDPNGDYVTTTW